MPELQLAQLGAEVSGPIDERCVWCENGTGTHWHTHCWHEAHDYFDED